VKFQTKLNCGKKEKAGADRNSRKLSIGMASNNDDGIWKKNMNLG